MKVLGVIPARMAATRFPNKPLADLAGRPLVQWVYEAASTCDSLHEVVVATPDPELADRVREFGGDVVMTSPDHQSGTDRVAEVARGRGDVDVVVNVQGDQPFVTGEMLHELVSPFSSDTSVVMTTLGAPLPSGASGDHNIVKVVCDINRDALYFSRSDIPYFRHPGAAPVFHHVGLYAFTREFLQEYSRMSPTPLEGIEALEQLRVLEHGIKIRVQPISAYAIEVNTPQDLEIAVNLLETQ